MSRRTDVDEDPREQPKDPAAEEIRFEDRRRWAHGDAAEMDDETERPEPARPTILDEYRERTESAERKLQEYIEAFKSFKDEQEAFRQRMQRDVDRRVDLKFGDVAAELLESVDDLERALDHAGEAAGATSLVEGVRMVRDRILAGLERQGVERIDPLDLPFDPNVAEAVRMDPVDDPERNGTVTEVLRPGYRLGERVIRAARVAVGRG